MKASWETTISLTNLIVRNKRVYLLKPLDDDKANSVKLIQTFGEKHREKLDLTPYVVSQDDSLEDRLEEIRSDGEIEIDVELEGCYTAGCQGGYYDPPEPAMMEDVEVSILKELPKPGKKREYLDITSFIPEKQYDEIVDRFMDDFESQEPDYPDYDEDR